MQFLDSSTKCLHLVRSRDFARREDFALLRMAAFMRVGSLKYVCAGVQTHILPREICGKSTFLVAMTLMKNLPLWLTDRLLVGYTYLTLGDTASVGIPRPKDGPMQLKESTGKTPILDVGTFAAIKSGQVKVLFCTSISQTS